MSANVSKIERIIIKLIADIGLILYVTEIHHFLNMFYVTCHLRA